MPKEFSNLFDHFYHSFSKNPSKPALILDTGKEYNFTLLNHISSKFASFFCELGVKPGDRISIQIDKSPESLCLYLACLKAGLTYHPLNPDYTENELSFFIENAKPTVIVCIEKKFNLFKKLAQINEIDHVFTLEKDGSGTLVDESDHCVHEFKTIETSSNHIAALLYSSGTTGRPKGIMLSHKNLISNTKTLSEYWEFTNEDVLLHALPIFHVHGLFVAIGCALYSGATMCWLEKFNVEKIIANLPSCSVLMGVPTYYTRLLASSEFSEKTCANMRVFISGSAPLLEETFHDFKQLTGHEILERYGMTETNMNTSNPISGQRKPGTVGPPLPGVEVRVVDDNENDLSINEIGNLFVRGPNVFEGYWKMPEKTEEDFTRDGYFKTGDKAKIDDDGYVSIVGRSKDMIISGGLNVYPKEVELILDDIEGIYESAVIGVPHQDLGEAVVAVVVKNETSAEITAQILIEKAKKELAGYKVPKQIIFVDALPRNTMSKVQKNVLRDTHKLTFT